MADVTRYAKYCGPSVVAAFAEVSRELAAEILDEIRTEMGRTTRVKTNIHDIEEGLKRFHFNTVMVEYTVREQVSMSQWLYDHPYGNYVVMVPGHVVAVSEGEVIEHNGYNPSKARVVRVIEVY